MMKTKISMKKKAQTGVQYLLENAFRIGFLMIALLAFFLLISFFISSKTDTKQLQAEVLANRILYSDAIMLYDDQIARVYPGIIDMNKFSTESLESDIKYSYSKHIAAKLTLQDKTKKVIKEIYLNQIPYSQWKVLIDSNIQGKESASYFAKELPVTLMYNENTPDENTQYATLIMEILVPNS